MSAGASKTLVLAVLWQALLPPARGEVFKFEQRPIPAPYSLQGLTAFTIYAPSDAPGGANGEHPWVEYRGLQAHSTSHEKADLQMAGYKSLQLALMSEDDYHAHIESGSVCNEMEQLEAKATAAEMHVTSFTETVEQHVELKKTGIYFLLMSNCGNFSEGTVTGSVAVKNPHGFVGATDYHKMVTFGWLFVAYVIAAIVWAILCAMWKSELIAMHGIVACVLVLGLIEAGAWYFYLSGVNQNGNVVDSIVCVLVMLTVLVNYTAYTFILVISQGWRMTEEVLDDCTLCKMGMFGLIFVVASYLREGAMTHRMAYHISSKFMTATIFPSMIVNVFIFTWISKSLYKLMGTLKERSMDEQYKVVVRFTVGLVASFCFGSLVFLVQLLDSTGSLKIDWKFQFLTDSGLSHITFLFLVCLGMFLWMPQANSSKMGYQPPAEQEEDGLWKEDGIEAASPHGNKIAPDTVGVADADEDL